MHDIAFLPTISTQNPLVIIGAGPVGLAAAAWAAERNMPFRILESGPSAGTNVRAWGHVRLFTPWRHLIDGAALRRLGRDGWAAPQLDVFPTGTAFADLWLDPLAASLGPTLETRTEVLKIERPGGTEAPFRLTVRRAGHDETVIAGAILDASGTWQTPNFLGERGAATGEDTSPIHYGVPDVLGRDRASYEGRRVLVVGAGHSAANVLIDLARLAEEAPNTEIAWAVRGGTPTRLFGGGEADQLPARGALGEAVHDLVSSGVARLHMGVRVAAVLNAPEGTEVVARDGRHIGPFDMIVAATGQRPDLSITSGLLLDLDPKIGAPTRLAPLIDPRIHSCGTVPPHGHVVLSHPERGYYAVGAKSYGTAPTFLMATGYEQVRSIVAALAGDWAAADDVRLVLPETGVCSGGGGGQKCCGGESDTKRACCELDAAAKRGGASGCGCQSTA
ncbi:NAD(P)-binding domain-containing protein [Billgrantia sp. Q4P2]|uniref:NAD(P)-binding domain-containing protein n=1 Tax=Billgrantia sp. Q4P2 TaxID=3463857 RepID=UPI0040570074